VEYSIRSSYFLSPPTDEEVRQRQRQGKARQGKARQGDMGCRGLMHGAGRLLEPPQQENNSAQS
jgi:hypothetical protein